MKIFIVYLISINAIASLFTIVDKYKAKKHKWRISESTLILLGFIGGAVCELLTMKLIRHKTKHSKFMLGLPAIIIFHLIIFLVYYFKVAQI